MSIEFGKKVKAIRKQSGESQDTFAKKLGYTSRSTISKIEDGEIDMSYEKIVDLINIYSIQSNTLFEIRKKQTINTRLIKLFLLVAL